MPSSTHYAVLLALVLGVGCEEDAETGTSLPPELPKATSSKLIEDPIVEAAIRKSLKKPEGKLTNADLKKVTRLNLSENRLTELPKSLELLTQLKRLGLSFNQLTSVEGLEKLTQLTRLDLSANQLTSVKGLEKLTQLTWLDLHYNQLTDVKGLEKLTQLKKLNLFFNNNLTMAQIDELYEALKIEILHNAEN